MDQQTSHEQTCPDAQVQKQMLIERIRQLQKRADELEREFCQEERMPARGEYADGGVKCVPCKDPKCCGPIPYPEYAKRRCIPPTVEDHTTTLNSERIYVNRYIKPDPYKVPLIVYPDYVNSGRIGDRFRPRTPPERLDLGKRKKSKELLSGVLWEVCDCTKRNGLQHDCPRNECQKNPLCAVKPEPLCENSLKARRMAEGGSSMRDPVLDDPNAPVCCYCAEPDPAPSEQLTRCWMVNPNPATV